MQEIPRLDYLLKNLSQLKGVYIEDNILPNLVLGNHPTLYNLEYLSFKGIKFLNFRNYFFVGREE